MNETTFQKKNIHREMFIVFIVVFKEYENFITIINLVLNRSAWKNHVFNKSDPFKFIESISSSHLFDLFAYSIGKIRDTKWSLRRILVHFSLHFALVESLNR